MTRRREVEEPVKRVVFGESGGRCTNPTCRAPLSAQSSATAIWIGECAHIHGEQPDARRFDAALSPEARNADSNLIALCPSCHTEIDKPGAEARYPATVLFRWKEARAAEVAGRAAQKVMDVGFQELSRVVQALVVGGFREEADDGVGVVPPDEKLSYNAMSATIRAHVAMGLARREEVGRYLHHERRVKPNITPIVRSAIVDTYRRCRARATGDALFHMVWSEVACGLYQDADRAAALVVTCYFFEACDIFESPPI